jgi:nucleoside-diphosphate-sugar epimerase
VKVLILGVGGFIGQNLARRILGTTDWHVVGLDRAAGAADGLLDDPRFSFHEDDLVACHSWVDEQIGASDVVLPLAALARPIAYVRDPLAVFELDFEENLRIIRKCFETDTRVVFPSSSEVYGMCADRSFDEGSSQFVLGPIEKERWMYSCCKQMLERVIWAYGARGLKFTVVRPFNWFGPDQDDIQTAENGSARVITQFLGHLLRGEPIRLVDGGHQRRCFTYVDDGIDALMRILHNKGEAATGRIFNIGTPFNDVSIGELVSIVANVLAEFPGWHDVERALEVRIESGSVYYGPGYEDVQARRPQVALAAGLLGWQPVVPLRAGLRNTIAYHLDQPLSGDRPWIAGPPATASRLTSGEPGAVDGRRREATT